jgi:paraquat-inducible protein A
MSNASLIACHECDELQRLPARAQGSIACHRCGAHLHVVGPYDLGRPLALTVTALVLFVIANACPMVMMEVQGTRITTTLLSAVHELWLKDVKLVSALVFITVIVAPLAQMAAMLYVLLPLGFGRVPPRVEFPLRLFQVARPWGMVEVFILGILVSLVKLAHMAHVVPGMALWAFAALVVVFAAIGSTFDPLRVWSHIGARP